MRFKIPAFVRPFLWSYDIEKLDRQADKKRIITNVLNLGTKKATDWLLSEYHPDEIRDVIMRPLPGEWSKKSLHFWSLMFGVTPGSTLRAVPQR